MTKKVYLVDWNNFIYRMFYALPEFATKDWKIVNAIFWMAKFFVWQLTKEKPDYLFFIKDAKWENFRHKLYSEYKWTRDKMPDNLKDQIKDIEEMIKTMWIDIIEISWFEADDVIWSLATTLWKNKELEIDILTWDKDLYSLVSDNVKIYDTMKKKKFWPDETKEKFWIEPSLIIDYLSIVWDKSDNIPWIAGFWPKKAIPLLNNIWSIESIYKIVEEIESGKDINSLNISWINEVEKLFKWKTFEKLSGSKGNAFLSKKLATIDKTIEIKDFKLENFKFFPEKILNEGIIKTFKQFEFNSLIGDDNTEDLRKWWDLGLKTKIIWDKQWLNDLFKKITEKGKITLDTETTSLNIIEAKLVWISILLDEKHIYYINRLHHWPKTEDKDLKDFLNKLFDLDILIIGHNIKYDLEIIELYLKNKTSENNQSKPQLSLSI